MISTVRGTRQLLADWCLPAAAKRAARHDRSGPPIDDPGLDRALDAVVAWICRAQDCSLSADGGVARHFSLVSGWSTSYPETTGYIVPSFLAYARLRNDNAVRDRAQRMIDWLLSIQFPDGAFQGGPIDADPVVPVEFNTGQILIGLAAAVREFGDRYRDPMRRAADWLVEHQNPDGAWRKHASPFNRPGDKGYDVHMTRGLFHAHQLDPNRGYADAAMKNVRWTMSLQRPNGWFDSSDHLEPDHPSTHAVGYVFRGLLEGYHHSRAVEILESCTRLADGLIRASRPDGFIPGRIDANWSGPADWSCLAGSSQIAECWFLMSQAAGTPKYRTAALSANKYVRRTIQLDGPPDTRGGVRGSFPISGPFGRFEYLNWAAKFFIDAQLLERTIAAQG